VLDHLPGHYENSSELVKKSKEFKEAVKKLKSNKQDDLVDRLKVKEKS
jgi:hypothetical protein